MNRILEYKSVKALCLFLVVAIFFTTCPVTVSAGVEVNRSIRLLSNSQMRQIKGGDSLCGDEQGCQFTCIDDSGCTTTVEIGYCQEMTCPTSSGGQTVFLANGEERWVETDFVIPIRGNTKLYVSRLYASQSTYNRNLGYGWKFTVLGTYLSEHANGDVSKHNPSGGISRFLKNQDNTYQSQAGSYFDLTKNQDGTFTMTNRVWGFKFNFSAIDADNNAWLASIVDKNNNQVTLNYDAGNKLTKVTDPSDRNVTFLYDGTAGLLTSMTDPDNRQVTFSYTLNGSAYDMTQKVGLEGNTTYYYYDSSHNMTKRTDPRGNDTVYAFDGNDRCTKENDHTYSYNPSLSVATLTDPNGYTTTVYYTENGMIDQVNDPFNNIKKHTYFTDPASRGDYLRPKELIDKNNYTTSYLYDNSGNRTTETNRLGYIMRYKYGTNNKLTSLIDPRGYTSKYFYDANKNQTKHEDANNGLIVYAYDSYGHTTGFTNQDNYTTAFEFDTYGSQTRTIDALSRANKVDYDTLGNITRKIDPAGNTTSYQYDNLFRVTKRTDAASNVTTLSYDKNGNVTRDIDANNNTSTYNYDSGNRLTKVTDPANQTITLTYDSNGNRTRLIDKVGNTHTYYYDKLNRMTKMASEIYTFTYDKEDNLTSMTDPNNKTISYYYDKENHRTKNIDANNNTAIYTYDENSNLTSLIDTRNSTTKYTYDKLNRLTRKTDALNQNTDYVYNGVGRVTKLIDPASQTTTYTYDAVGSLTLTTLPDGTNLNLGYDDLNRRTKLVDGYGTSTWAYDNLSRITRKIYPDGATFKYYYDSIGNRTKLSNADNNEFTYNYDQNSRITKLINPYSQTTSITYNASGQPTQINYSNGTKTVYSYDSNSRITSLANRKSDNSTIETYAYLYDASGNRTKVTFSNGDYINYLYDGTNQLTKETRKNSSNVIEYDYSYVYDAIGNRTSIDDTNFSDNFNRTDSTNLGSDWSEVTGNWEILSNRLSIPDASDNAVCIWTGGDFTNPSIEAIMNAETAGTPRRSGIIVSYQSTSDFYYTGAYPQSNKWVIGRYQNGTWTDSTTLTDTINKNQDYELRTEVSGTTVTLYVKETGSWVNKLSYNFGTLPAGDVGVTVEQSHTKFDNFKVGGGVDAVYGYNSINQLTKSVKGGTTRTYLYDARGNLTRKIQGSNTTNYYFDNQNQLTKVTLPDATNITYTYSDGRRVKRLQGSNTTKYYYDDFRVLMEKDATGTVATYTTLPIYTGYILSDRRGTTDVWYHTNAIGTINNLTNAQESAILTVESDAFGNIQSQAGTGGTNYHLTTKELDPDTGLYYFVARWYDPVEGRFISQDPKPEANLYWYVKNNPVNEIDPLGLHTVKECMKEAQINLDKCVDALLDSIEQCYEGCNTIQDPNFRTCCVILCFKTEHEILLFGIPGCGVTYRAEQAYCAIHRLFSH